MQKPSSREVRRKKNIRKNGGTKSKGTFGKKRALRINRRCLKNGQYPSTKRRLDFHTPLREGRRGGVTQYGMKGRSRGKLDWEWERYGSMGQESRIGLFMISNSWESHLSQEREGRGAKITSRKEERRMRETHHQTPRAQKNSMGQTLNGGGGE